MMLVLIMSFKNLKKIYSLIAEKAKNNECYTEEWKNFCFIAKNLEKNPPTAFEAIHNILNRLKKKMNKKNIFILDHGCGSGMTVIYLAALGYTKVHGINVNFDVAYLNKILKDKFNINKKKFFTTDGKKVPFKDEYFDFIISAQVVEHLREDEVFLYYKEEGRVLKKKGFAYHEVPHKYIPFESHSRLWIIHLLPYFIKPILYGVIMSIRKKENLFFKGSYYAKYFSKNFLILRSPSFHKKMIKENIGNFEDLTVKRLSKKTDFSSYDNDSPLGLRKLIQKIFLFPLIGRPLVFIFKNLFILQTISIKN